MSGPQEPYEVESHDAANPAPGQPAGGAPSDPAAKPRLFNIPLPPPAEGGKGKIDAPKLLEGFPEDADFDKDPELDKVITGKTGKTEAAHEAPAKEDFVKPGLGNAKVWGVVGTVLLVGALIATGTTASGSRFAEVMLALYNALLHSGTGVVAILIAATLLRKQFGNFELGAARMFTAVSAFSLLFALHPTVFNVGWLDNLLDLMVASAAYVLIVCSTFGLWKKTPLAYVAGSHFFLWMIVQIGMMLSAYVAAHTPEVKAVPREPSPTQTHVDKPLAKPSSTPAAPAR